MLFVLALVLLALLSCNVLVWWSIFLMMTLVFLMINKGSMSYSSLFNYFVLQESLGLMFLLMSFGYIQLIMLMLKIGVAPLHFWIFSVINGVSGYSLMWFLTFQKLPFLVILLQMLVSNMLYLLLMGLLMCLLQMMLVKSYKSLLVLSSTESFNWVVVGFMLSFVGVLLLFVYYFFMMVYLIPKFGGLSVEESLGWETVLVFMNLPFSVNFFIKIFALAELLKFYSFVVLLILLIMFMSVLSLGYWLVNLSTKSILDLKYNKVFLSFYLFAMLLVIY